MNYKRIKAMTDRGTRQRENILAVAASLFWQKGYLGTNVDDIANAARVNKAITYYYFENKASLLFEVCFNAITHLIEITLPIAKSDLPPARKLEALIKNHLRWQMENRESAAGLGQVELRNIPAQFARKHIKMRDEYEAIFTNTIEAGILQGEFRNLTQSCVLYLPWA